MNLTILSKYIAEFLGTLILLLIGCAGIIIAGSNSVFGVQTWGIAFAFSLAVVALGCITHRLIEPRTNPSVSLNALFIARIKKKGIVIYVIALLAGAVAGAAILLLISSGPGAYEISVNGLSHNEYDGLAPLPYGLLSGFVAETVFMVIFTLVVLGATTTKNIRGGFAGVSVGLSLIIIHIIGIPITGISVNPIRSVGPALLVDSDHIKQLWLLAMSPITGSVLGAIVWRYLLELN